MGRRLLLRGLSRAGLFMFSGIAAASFWGAFSRIVAGSAFVVSTLKPAMHAARQ